MRGEGVVIRGTRGAGSRWSLWTIWCRTKTLRWHRILNICAFSQISDSKWTPDHLVGPSIIWAPQLTCIQMSRSKWVGEPDYFVFAFALVWICLCTDIWCLATGEVGSLKSLSMSLSLYCPLPLTLFSQIRMTTVSVRWGRAFPSVHSICSCLHFRFCLWNKFLPLERRIPWWRDLWDQAPFLCSLDLAAMNTRAWIYSPAMKWNIKLMHSHFQVFTCEFIAVIARDFRISRAFWFDRILFTFFSWGFNFFCLPAGLIFCIKVLQHTDGWSWIPWLWYDFFNQGILYM